MKWTLGKKDHAHFARAILSIQTSAFQAISLGHYCHTQNRNGGNVLGWMTSCQVSQHMQYSNQSTTTIALIVIVLHKLHFVETSK